MARKQRDAQGRLIQIEQGWITFGGRYSVGPYCGSTWKTFFSGRDFKSYGLFRKVPAGFSIGPILFWREIYLDELGY